MRQGSNSGSGRRPRGRTNRRQPGGGGNPRTSNYESNGPEGRIRGNASQVYEKYLALARDATSSGDRIIAEAFYQHAEHYFRIMNESTDPRSGDSSNSNSEQRPQHRQQQRENGREGGAQPVAAAPFEAQIPPAIDIASEPQPDVIEEAAVPGWDIGSQAQPAVEEPQELVPEQPKPPRRARTRRERPAKPKKEAEAESAPAAEEPGPEKDDQEPVSSAS